MKKALIYMFAGLLMATSCRKDDENAPNTIKEVADLTTQNANDDAAITKYLDEHYLDAQGKIMTFSSTDTSDDNYPKLSALNPVKLASGVVVITRQGAQPDPGKTIGATDILRLMHKTTTFLSNAENGTVTYASEYPFINTIDGSGGPQVNPFFYYTDSKTLTASGKPRTYYEIEGFQEGLKYFKSCEIEDQQNYNLQGVIIVPSRAAYARDEHYPYGGVSWRNRTFVFNFQVYKTTARPAGE